MARLALVVPSRERPQNIARLIHAMSETCRGETDLIVGVDDDDPTLDQYLAFENACEIVVRSGLQRQLVKWLNTLAVPAANDYSYVGHIGDDNVPRTHGWDVMVTDSLQRQGPVSFCFGDDLDPGRVPGSLSIHIFMTSNVIRRLGYMGPERVQHMYVDPIWYAWGKATSIEFLPAAVLEHLHYTLGRSSRDESYEHSTGLIPQDCAGYNAYCDDPDGLNADVAKLDGQPYSVEELAEFNQALNIPRVWGTAA